MTTTRVNLALEPDFNIGALKVSPSACRVMAETEEIRIEAQTMTVLVVLARTDGATVSREELIESCWQGRIVSDDAVTRTIAKVRALSRAMTPAPFVLETLPKVGYRLIADAATAGVGAAEPAAAPAPTPMHDRLRAWRPMVAAAALVLAAPIVWALLPRSAAPGQPEAASEAGQNLPTAAQVSEALILLDLDRVRGYLNHGWNPNWKLDGEGSNALQALFIACERNPSHDRGMVAKIAQELVRAGVDVAAKNKWGDTALDIASSPRYCGPKHPVVDFLKSMTPAEATKAAGK